MLYSRNINWPHEDWKNVRHIPPASTGLYARAFTRGSVVKVTRECLKIKVRVSCSEWKCFSRDGTLFSGIYFPLKTCDWRCFDHYKVVFLKQIIIFTHKLWATYLGRHPHHDDPPSSQIIAVLLGGEAGWGGEGIVHEVQQTGEKIARKLPSNEFPRWVIFALTFHLPPCKGILSFWGGLNETGENCCRRVSNKHVHTKPGASHFSSHFINWWFLCLALAVGQQ